MFSISIGRGSQEEDWRQSLSRMFSQNQRWRPRGVRTCHPCRAPVEERTRPQEIEMPDIVICQGRAVAWDFESWRSIALWQPRDGVSSICLDIRLRPGLANGGAFFTPGCLPYGLRLEGCVNVNHQRPISSVNRGQSSVMANTTTMSGVLLLVSWRTGSGSLRSKVKLAPRGQILDWVEEIEMLSLPPFSNNPSFPISLHAHFWSRATFTQTPGVIVRFFLACEYPQCEASHLFFCRSCRCGEVMLLPNADCCIHRKPYLPLIVGTISTSLRRSGSGHSIPRLPAVFGTQYSPIV